MDLKDGMHSIALLIILPFVIVLAGCASPLPIDIYDLRPAGNAGVTVDDISAHTWVLSKTKDKMTGANGYSATIWSLNTIELPFPYENEQKLILTVGRGPQGNSYAALSIPRGQFSCHQCDIRIRFDDGSPRLWTGNAPMESTNFLTITGERLFIEKLQNSKRVMIDVPFYSHGNAIIEFDSSGFPW